MYIRTSNQGAKLFFYRLSLDPFPMALFYADDVFPQTKKEKKRFARTFVVSRTRWRASRATFHAPRAHHPPLHCHRSTWSHWLESSARRADLGALSIVAHFHGLPIHMPPNRRSSKPSSSWPTRVPPTRRLRLIHRPPKMPWGFSVLLGSRIIWGNLRYGRATLRARVEPIAHEGRLAEQMRLRCESDFAIWSLEQKVQ